MRKEIDARGLSCPEPVILTRKALGEFSELTVIVNDETARDNVRRLAESMGCSVSLENRGTETSLHITNPGQPGRCDPLMYGSSAPLPGPTVLVMASDTMGRGNDELGAILMKSFLHTLGEADAKPDTMILFNTGVKLAVQGSDVIDDLRLLVEKGVRILVCGTCLGYFEMKDKLAAGVVSNMYDITDTMMKAGKIVQV